MTLNRYRNLSERWITSRTLGKPRLIFLANSELDSAQAKYLLKQECLDRPRNCVDERLKMRFRNGTSIRQNCKRCLAMSDSGDKQVKH